MLISSAASATTVETLYFEDFTGQDGLGISGAGSDFTGVDWFVDAGDGTLSNSGDYIQVVGGELSFEDVDSSICTGTGLALDCSGVASWSSSVIDVSAYTNLDLSLDYGFAAGSGMLEVSGVYNDDLVTALIIDGNVASPFFLADFIQSNTYVSNSADTTGQLNTALADATALQVVVYGTTSGSPERIYIDNVQLTGTASSVGAPPAVPLPASGLLLIGGIVVFLRRRR